MKNEKAIQERLAALEREVADLKSRLDKVAPDNWLGRLIGSMKDYPEFKKVAKYGAAFRRSQRPPKSP
jgi:hypothetical protein